MYMLEPMRAEGLTCERMRLENRLKNFEHLIGKNTLTGPGIRHALQIFLNALNAYLGALVQRASIKCCKPTSVA